MIEVKADKVATLPVSKDKDNNNNNNKAQTDPPTPTPRKELNLRAKKPKHGDRAANKGDGSLVLVRRPSRSICFDRPR